MKTWRQAVSGLWTRVRPWTIDHPEPWKVVSRGPRVYQGQRRRRASPLRPRLRLRSLAGQVGVKRRHQSCTGTEEEEEEITYIAGCFLMTMAQVMQLNQLYIWVLQCVTQQMLVVK